METITIKISGKQNVSFFIDLIEKFNFIKEFTVLPVQEQNDKKDAPPIDWAKKKPSIDDFAGIWHDNPITLDKIRSKGWKRN